MFPRERPAIPITQQCLLLFTYLVHIYILHVDVRHEYIRFVTLLLLLMDRFCSVLPLIVLSYIPFLLSSCVTVTLQRIMGLYVSVIVKGSLFDMSSNQNLIVIL